MGTMNRRDFLRRSALLAAGVVAADQMDLLDRLGWKRKLFPGWSPPSRSGGLYRITSIESSYYPDRLSTMTVGFDGEYGGGAVVLDGDAEPSRRFASKFRVGEWVRLSGDWGDWPQLGKSLLES